MPQDARKRLEVSGLPDLKEIRARRVKLGISQRKMAKEIGVSQSMVARIERGKLNPTYRVVERIFRYLDGRHSLTMGNAGMVASRHVTSVHPSDSVAKVIRIMQSHGFKQLPVLDGSHTIGSISERGLSKRILETKNREHLLRKRVWSVMEEALPTVPEEVPVEGIVALLQRTQAILTTKGGRVSGIITNADLLKLVARIG